MKVRDLLERSASEDLEIDWSIPKGLRSYVVRGELAPVWIDVAKLDASWSKDDGYIGPGGAGGIRTRYPDFGRWLQNAPEPVEMSEVSIDWRGNAMFINGRHRFSWMRDHGAAAVPVMVPTEQVEQIETRFGTGLRQTFLAHSTADTIPHETV
jgi:hypothetical protein